MALLVPDEGEVKMLDLIFVSTDVLELYKDRTTAPAESDTWSTYSGTLCDFTGYSAYTLSTWNGASTSSGTSSKTHPSHPFSVGSTNLIVGYIIRDNGGTPKIKVVERIYSTGQTYNNGDSITITPRINLD